MLSSLRRSMVTSAVLGGGLTLLMPLSAHADCTFGGTIGPGGAQFHSFLAATSNALTSSVTAMNTGFQTQTSAFLSSPSSSQPDQFASGLWGRAVAGRMDTDSNSTGTVTPPKGGPLAFPSACSTETRNDYTGVQGGYDIGRLNFGASGWNAHIGLTGGFFQTEATSQQGSGITRTQVPFAGVYGALINGRFFIDAQVVGQSYNVSSSEPSLFAAGNMDGQGFGITSSAGYNFQLDRGWFIEPSASVVYSKVRLDSLQLNAMVLGGAFANQGPVTLPATIGLGDIETLPARLGVRVGNSFDVGGVALSPFATASIWHEFAGNTTANASFLPGVGRPLPLANPGTFDISSTRIGTFGQYSLGLNASLPGTGWLGYARIDYRNGQNIEALSVNGGIRYQFAPGAQVAAAPQVYTKAPMYAKAPVATPFSWTGFYLGGFAGDAWAGRVTATELPPAFNGTGSQSSFDLGSNFMGGLDFGYNYQSGVVVVGGEAEGGFLRLSGAAPFVTSQQTVAGAKVGDWYAAFTGRLGLAVGSALIYAKGGAAIVDVTDSVIGTLACTTPVGPPLCAPGLRSVAAAGRNKLGVTWAAGAGLEYAINKRWSIKGEYLALGTDLSNTASGPGLVSGINAPQRFNWLFNIPTLQTAKLGVNYKL